MLLIGTFNGDYIRRNDKHNSVFIDSLMRIIRALTLLVTQKHINNFKVLEICCRDIIVDNNYILELPNYDHYFTTIFFPLLYTKKN